MEKKKCKICKKEIRVFNSLQNKCFDCSIKTYKPINKKGRRTLEYEKWRDQVAKTYLDKHYGHVCSEEGCKVKKYLEVDHIKKRSTHPHLVMVISNVCYKCGDHHLEKHA